ncbi:hypothetical protein FI667_g1661, partial [Globisporangium splendens]
MQIEQLSDAIRLRNKKLFKESDAPDGSLTLTAQNRAQVARSNAVEMERKPPVPRQRGRRRGRTHDRNSQLREMTDAIASQLRQRDSTRTSLEAARRISEGSTSNAPVSSSILLGDSRSLPAKDVRQSIGEESHEGPGESAIIQDDVPAPNSNVHQAPARATPKRTRKTRKATATSEQPQPDPISQRERSERREHAREFMELQKQRRQIMSARQRQGLEMERERRRLQLEILEQERLASLRCAKKKKRRRVSVGKEGHNSPLQSGVSRHSAEREIKMAHSEADIDDRMESEIDRVDDEYMSSDQENKRNSRNLRSVNAPSPMFSGAGRLDDHDASILVNHPSNSYGPSKEPSTPEVDARLRRLLELEGKALKLSELVNGIKSKKARTPTFSPATNRAEETGDIKKESCLQTALHSMDIDRSEEGGRLSTNERRGESVDEESDREGEVRYSGRESTFNDRNGTNDSDKDPGNSEESRLPDRENDDADTTDNFQHEQRFGTEELRLPADTFIDIEANIEETENLNSGDELDPRCIGVHNIRGEWPIERHQLGDYDTAVNRPPSSSRSSSCSSHSGGQFVGQHPSPSNRGSLSSGGSEQADSDVFETSIHTYIQQRLRLTTSALRISTGASAANGPSEGNTSRFDDYDELARTAKNTTFQSIQPKKYGLRDTIALRANDERARAEAQEAFLKVVRDTDDSLSVVNSTATKIWLEQQQRVKARIDQKPQQEQARKEEEQRVKDELLKSVMDSLRMKPEGGDENDRIKSHDEAGETMFEYERLEDIMQEVQKEWVLEKQEQDSNVIVGSQTQANAAPDEGYQNQQMSSSVTYWNDMLANSSPLQQSKNSLKMKSSMPRTVIDTSELGQQRAQQKQLEDELTESYKDEVRRVHSPKTLARLLLAEVGYHEAVHGAHLQLAVMEQAQVVEQAHVETIHVADAFKEEMENNMTSHQIALEHAILAQQYDGDLLDVMHELESIQQTQTNEAAIASASLHLELRKANLRESTVQTDELKRVDATTNAKLYVESGTTTSPGVSDAAVQYEPPEEESSVPTNAQPSQPPLTRVADQVVVSSSTGMESSAEHGYSEEEYEDDNFESASQSVVDPSHQKSNDVSVSGVASSVVGEETSKSVHESDDPEAEIVSEDEGEASTSRLRQSETASDPYEDDEIRSENSVEEGQNGGSKAESIPSSEIDDTISDDEKNYQSDTGGKQVPIESTSLGYDDDFEASSSQPRVQRADQTVEDESVKDEDEESQAVSEASDIGDEVREGSGVTSSDGLVSAESRHSPEFSENVVDQPKPGRDISNVLPSPSPNIERAEPQITVTAVQSTRYMVEHASESLRHNAMYGSDELAQAYQRDLEMRKNSDEPLLLFRLQVLEQNFQRDLLAIEDNVNMMARMPVLSSPPLGARVQISPHPSLIKQQPSQPEPTERERMMGTETDDYGNEFDSVSEKAEVKSEYDGSEGGAQSQSVYSEKEEDIQSQQSVNSEKEDEFDVEEPAKSIVDDDDDVKSDASAKYDEDAYDDDLASVSRSEVSSAARDEGEDEDLENHSVEGDNASDVAEADDSSAKIDEGTASEVQEDQIISDSDASKEGKEAEKNEYDNEFTFISESDRASLTQKPATDDGIGEDEEEKIDDLVASDDVPSDQSSDHYSTDDMVEEDHLQSSEKDQGAMATGKINVNDAHDEDTDEDEVNLKLPGPFKSVDTGGSILVVEQSESDDSPTTKLLIEQVNALNQQSKNPTEVEIKYIEGKIERKRIKAIELIQAKERLIKQEKHKFKQEEERHQVDTLAQIALRMDVTTELSKAKADIKQGLENEMKTLQQVYPTLLGTNSVQLQGDVPAPGAQQTQQIPKSSNKNKVAEHLAQPKVSESQFEAETEANYEKEDNYEDSFEVEQSVPDIDYEEDKSVGEEEYESLEDDDASQLDRKVESTSNVSAIIAEDGDEIASDTERYGEPEHNDVESEIQSDNDGDSDDIEFDTPADSNGLEDDVEDVDPLPPRGACDPQSSAEPLASDDAAYLSAGEMEGSLGDDVALSNEGDECEPQHVSQHEETPRGGQSHCTLAEPVEAVEASKSDHKRVPVQSADGLRVAQNGHQGNDESEDSEDGSAVQSVEQSTDIRGRTSEDLVDHVTDALYAGMFDSIMQDATSFSYRLQSRRNLSESATPEVSVRSRVCDTGLGTSVKSKDGIQEKDHARNAVSQEEYENCSDESAMKTSPAASEYTKASKDFDPGSGDTICDRIAEQMFDELCNSVVDSEVQISRKLRVLRHVAEPQRSHLNDSDGNSSENDTPLAPEVAKVSHAGATTVKQKKESKVQDERELVSEIIEALDIQAGNIRLSECADVKRSANLNLGSSRLLCEVIQEIAEDLLFRQQRATMQSAATGSGQLAAQTDHHVDIVELRQKVEIEIDRILSIRATGGDELTRQMRNLTKEMDSSQVTREDQLMMQTQFRTNIDHVADRVRLNVIASNSEAATSANSGIAPGHSRVRTPRSFYPRTPTPTSRPTSRRPMLLNTLFNRESAQLQERITNFILGDLLQPDQLGLEC